MSDSSDLDRDDSIEVDTIIDYLDHLLAANGERLEPVEKLLFTGIWDNLTYAQISRSCRYSPDYLAKEVSPNLREKLGKLFSISINKKSLKPLIERYYRQHPLSPLEDNSHQSNSREYCYIKVDTNVYTVEISIPDITNDLRYSVGDFSIQIERKVISGSAIFFCNGTVRSMNRLVTMFAEGELTEVAGLRILDLNFMRVWLERLFSNSWEEAEQILSRSGNRNIRSGDDSASPTSSSLTKARLVKVVDNIQLIIVAKFEYKSALETIITFSIYPNSEPYLPTNLTIEVLDLAGSIVMQERIAAPNIDAIELPFTIEVEEHFSLRITDRDREIIEQF